MRLFELQWEKVYNWEKGAEHHGIAMYHFVTDKNVKYIVKFKTIYTLEKALNLTAYDLLFEEMTRGTMGLTGTGDVVGVFSTVSEIAKDFVRTHPEVDVILFTGVGSYNQRTGKRSYGRVKFYMNRAKLLADKLGMGYLVDRFSGGIDVYLTKNDKVKDMIRHYRGLPDETV